VLKKKIGKFKLKGNPYLTRRTFDIKQAEVKDEKRRKKHFFFGKALFPRERLAVIFFFL